MPGGITPGTNPNKNLYNGGSEWQDDFGDLPDLMQTYYRNYDQALGRWTGVDPDAEGAESLSTFNYSGNNPVMFNDPLGNLMTGNPGSDRHEAWLNANSAFNPDGTIKTGVDRELENWLSGGGGSKVSGDYSDFWEDVVNNANQKNSNIVTYTSADLNHIFLGDYSILLPEININGPLPSWWGDSQLFLNGSKSLSGRTVIANQIGVGQPGFGESLIPVWGSGRAAIDDFQNGNYWRGIGYTALAISDVFLVKAAATAIGKAAATGVGKLAAKESVEYSVDLELAAQKLYPNKTWTELHHIAPKYLGGPANGPLVPLNAAYHQLITNEFRILHPYGLGPVTPTRMQEIMLEVYSKFPLPIGYGF